MNVTAALIARIEARRTETAKPCKSYSTETAAEKVAAVEAANVARYFGHNDRPMRYVVAFNAAWGRWVIGFDMTEMLHRPKTQGGYLGILADRGFFSY